VAAGELQKSFFFISKPFKISSSGDKQNSSDEDTESDTDRYNQQYTYTHTHTHTHTSIKFSSDEWRNDGVAAASSDGGPTGRQREKRPDGAGLRPEKVKRGPG